MWLSGLQRLLLQAAIRTVGNDIQAGAEYHDAAGTQRAEAGNQPGNGAGGRAQHRQVRHGRQILHIRITRVASHFRVLGINRVDRPRETARQHIGHHGLAQAVRPDGSAHDGQRFWREQVFEITYAHELSR